MLTGSVIENDSEIIFLVFIENGAQWTMVATLKECTFLYESQYV